MPEDKFKKIYSQLNHEQKLAVDTIEGPVMVVAGPGTGKTRTLILRIANILRLTDTQPENILALTFTDSAAFLMRSNLSEIIGSLAYRVKISTFHSFCNDIINNYPEEFPKIIGSRNITEAEQVNIIENLISKLPLQILKPFGNNLYYVKDIVKNIGELKRENVSPEKLELIVNREIQELNSMSDLHHKNGSTDQELKQIEKVKELVEIYKQYEKELSQLRLYDYDDMIVEVVKTLEQNKNFLLMLEEQYQYILVDEHQDTNNAQNRILELLSSYYSSPNLFVVGDEKQAIFRFQGASLENFLYFKKKYPTAKYIVLKRNYRSTQTILDSASDLIKNKQEKLISNSKEKGEKILIYSFSKPEVENYFLARDIKEKIAQGVKPEEIAILYRRNKDAFEIIEALDKLKINYSLESDENVLLDLDIQKLILLLEAINDFGNNEKLAKLLILDFLEIEPLDAYKIIDYANKKNISLYEAIKYKKHLKSAGLSQEGQEKISQFYKKISDYNYQKANKNLVDLFNLIINDSGFLTYILRHQQAQEKIEKLSSLFDEIKSLLASNQSFNLENFINYLNTLKKHNLAIKKSYPKIVNGKIRLMTAHRAKGQEFEYVYICKATSAHWEEKPNHKGIKLPAAVYAKTKLDLDSLDAENDDERRLFYVCLTRAKQKVIITYSKEDELKKQQLPSKYIAEINKKFIKIGDSSKYEKDILKEKFIFKKADKQTLSLKDKDYLRQKFLENSLSVTALNNYLECPSKYLFLNLLRLPTAQTKSQIYGTAVHNALKDFFQATAISRKIPTKQFLLEKFKYYISKSPLNRNELDESLKKGERALTGYYNENKNKWLKNILVELKIDGVKVGDISISGRIDKIEILKQEINGKHEVNVVDYKTSQPKSPKEIKGETKSKHSGDLFRQLVFYKILLDNYKNNRYKMVSGEFDFIEPNKKGEYKKESFSVSEKDVLELELLIKKISQEILSLEFLNKFCSDKDCQYCKLKRMAFD